MPYSSPEKKALPAAGDNYNYIAEQVAFANSIHDVVSVVNRTEADAIVTAMATDGRPVTDANLLIVFNNETKSLEIRDSSGWRPMVSTNPMGHMGQTNLFQLIGTGVYLTFSAAQILRGGVTFNNATDSLIIPTTGLYRFNLRILATGGTAYVAKTWLRRNTVNTGIYTYFPKDNSGDYTSCVSGIMQLTAGDAMSLWMETDTDHVNAASYGSTGYDGTYLEVEMIGF